MMKPRVYVETTIPSLYHDTRPAPAIVARREWTREWWSGAAEAYKLVTSAAVLNELTEGIPERSAQRLALVRDLPLLPIEPPIREIVESYIRHKLMLPIQVETLCIWHLHPTTSATSWSRGIAGTLPTRTSLDTFVG